MPTQIPNNTNFSPYISGWESMADGLLPGEPIYTEVARSFVPLVGRTALTEIFPEEIIEQRVVVIQQSQEATTTIMPLVDWGKQDVVTGQTGGTSKFMMVQPLVIRQTKFIAHGELNTRLRPGTMNERWSPSEQIDRIIETMVQEHALTWDVYRALMLLGGIHYTDPRTGVSVEVSAQIPPHNFWSYNVSAGFMGRNESLMFKSVLDSNTTNSTTSGVPFTDPNADLLMGMRSFANWFKVTNKSRVTAMYLSADLAHILMNNNQVKLSQGGTVFGMGSAPIVRDSADPISMNQFTMNAEGLSSISGIPLRPVETGFRDPVTNLYRPVFPKNKIVAVSEVNSNGGNEAPGRTQYCVSEESGGRPGLWTRTVDETQPPAPPGMYIQMGNAGLPYLKFPYRVAHLNVASPQAVNNRLGIVGDYNFGVI